MSATHARQILTSSGSNEWYTPAYLLDPARAMVGGFDLDPASCAIANETVRAARYYTIADDGLAQTWHGRVWCNPPYGSSTAAFVQKAIREHRAGNTSDTFLLLKAATDTAWFRPLFAYPLCFIYGRVRFNSNAGTKATATFPSVLAYLGCRNSEFAHAFQAVGCVLTITREETTHG